MINTSKTWHSPVNTYWHIQKLIKKIGYDVVDKKTEYQNVREANVGFVMASILFQRTGEPTYLQLYKPDPPDVILMQPFIEPKGTNLLYLVEITSYIGEPKESLLEQLKRTKVKPNINTLSEEYILAVNIGIGLNVESEYKLIRDYLNKNEIPFPVWTIQETQRRPDTIARVVIINPKIKKINVNIGEAIDLFKKSGKPDVLYSRRVSKPELVRLEKSEKCHEAPWETIGK
ncbi:hypothetical protein KKA23_01540 [Patescibacteria group bacterium]|nr:hypothetical protein [Patescibacteria group bacterium]